MREQNNSLRVYDKVSEGFTVDWNLYVKIGALNKDVKKRQSCYVQLRRGILTLDAVDCVEEASTF